MAGKSLVFYTESFVVLLLFRLSCGILLQIKTILIVVSAAYVRVAQVHHAANAVLNRKYSSSKLYCLFIRSILLYFDDAYLLFCQLFIQPHM